MITIFTRQGKRVEIILERELRSPVDMGERVRAYCHIHGSDHQRSLSITKARGWGHCFNAACGATVLVAEWNRPLANRLLQGVSWGMSPARTVPSLLVPGARTRPTFVQPMLLPPPRSIPSWQREECEALLALDEQTRRALTETPRAQRYLRERGIPLAIARTAGVGYLPPALLNRPEMREQRRLLYRWVDRLLFPLTSPEGMGYIGRSLWRWQPGISETVHKTLLEQRAGPKRWIKTNPAGWFGMESEELPRTVILVEGAFDRLTLLAAGFQAGEIVALAGTALHADWFPARVRTVVLALDGDEGGREASARLGDQLAWAGLDVQTCLSRQDRWGKDWNERWQRLGYRSVTPVVEVFSEARSA
ncbi:MAG TPA: toprim domain-containing protein [Ktedonobacteraceae bacterium]